MFGFFRGLRVASANAKEFDIHSNSIRSISYTSEGIPLNTPGNTARTWKV
jgi:hypothetical protein